MATVQLSDIINVTVFRDLPPVNGPEKTAFFQSGIVTRNSLFDELANAAGKTAELPFWKDVDGASEVNYTSDDPADVAVPENVVQGEQVARKAFVNKGWSASDLATELALGTGAMEHIRARTDMYFQRQWQRRLISATNGVLADNVANDASDMVHDIAVEAVASQAATTKFSREAFIEAAFTLGDNVDGVTAVAMHSAVAKQVANLNDAEDVRDSEGNLLYQAYMGRRIIVDDGLPVIAGTTDGFKYVTVLFGPQAFGYGEGAPPVPVEVEREATQGGGGGIESLWRRATWILHPFGFKQITTVAPANGFSYTQTELATAGLWDRVVDRKSVPMAFLITN